MGRITSIIMKTIELFNEMMPEVPQYTDGNHMFSMQGVDPLYYLADGSVQEKQVAPLTASYSPVSIFASIIGNIVQIVPAGVNRRSTTARADVFFITDQMYIYSASSTYGIISLGNITGSVTLPDKTARLAVGANGYLTVVAGSSNLIYTNPLSQGGVVFPDTLSTTWTPHGPGDYFANLNIKQAESFQNYMALTTVKSLGLTTSRVNLYPYNNNYATTASGYLDLGDGWNIMRLVNYKNKYLAIGATYASNQIPYGGAGTLSDSSISYIFFWNGSLTSTTRYQFAVQVPGTLVDMCMSDNMLYVIVVDRNNNYALYQYSGGETLRKVFNIQTDTPSLYVGCALFAYPSGVGINLQNKGAYVYTENNNKKYRYILTTSGNTSAFCISSAGILYGGKNDGSWFYYPTNGGAGFNDIDATTQWIPVATKLSSVNIWYDTPPSVPNEYIRVTATAWGEDQNDGVTSQILSDITSTQRDTMAKTTLDLKGLTPTKLKLRVQTHSLGTWRPIIRGIELNEDQQTP